MRLFTHAALLKKHKRYITYRNTHRIAGKSQFLLIFIVSDRKGIAAVFSIGYGLDGYGCRQIRDQQRIDIEEKRCVAIQLDLAHALLLVIRNIQLQIADDLRQNILGSHDSYFIVGIHFSGRHQSESLHDNRFGRRRRGILAFHEYHRRYRIYVVLPHQPENCRSQKDHYAGYEPLPMAKKQKKQLFEIYRRLFIVFHRGNNLLIHNILSYNANSYLTMFTNKLANVTKSETILTDILATGDITRDVRAFDLLGST